MVRLPRYLTALAVAAVMGVGAEAAELGDAERGAEVWKKCKACHAIGAGATNRVGPHLNGIFGRKAASVDDFRYSKPMKRAGADGLVWHLEELDKFLENPKSLVTGSRMSFRGLDEPRDRADLLAFLRSYSDDPQNIPEADPTRTAREVALEDTILAIKGDGEYGEYLSSECTTCHQASGEDKGIPSIVGWPVEDFVYAMHAYKQKVRPHPVMQLMAGKLSNEEIAALAVYFNELE